MKKFDIITGTWKEPASIYGTWKDPAVQGVRDMIEVGQLITWIDYSQCETTHHLKQEEHIGIIKDITAEGVTIIDFVARDEKRFSVYSVLDFVRKKNKKYHLTVPEKE